MSHEHDRPPLGLQPRELAEAFLLERRVADGQHLVDQHDIGIDLDGDRKGEAHLHSGGVVLQLQVHERLELGKGDDLVQPLEGLPAGEAEHDRVDDRVVARGEVRVEPDAELDERRQAAVHLDVAGIDGVDAGQALEQRALAAAVASHDPEELARRDVDADILKCAELVDSAGCGMGAGHAP